MALGQRAFIMISIVAIVNVQLCLCERPMQNDLAHAMPTVKEHIQVKLHELRHGGSASVVERNIGSSEDSVTSETSELSETESVRWDELAPKLKTGDLILFSAAGGITSTAIKVGTWAEFTHVALVLVMRYDKMKFTWSAAAEQESDTVAEQGSDTVLCLMEVANHPAEDIVTADRYHGFQVVRLLDKVTGHRGEVFDYEKVSFIPLEEPLDTRQLAKLQCIVSCFHTVRTRYEKGANVARMILMTVKANSDVDMKAMFCSDFVAYVAYEMGWLSPESIGESSDYSSKNFSPQDFIKYIEASSWNEKKAMTLDMPSAFLALSQRTLTAAEENTIFPQAEAEYTLKRNLQYENELLRCDPTVLSYLDQNFPLAYQRFRATVDQEIQGQQLWGGEATYVHGGTEEERYVRLVAHVNADGCKSARLYYGGPGDGWYPNEWLQSLTLDKTHVFKVDRSQQEVFTFNFKAANHTDTGSFSVRRPHQPEEYGKFINSLLNQLWAWSLSINDLGLSQFKARMQSNKRQIWVYPTSDIQELQSLELPKVDFHFESGYEGVTHVLYAGTPCPLAGTPCPMQ